MDINESIRQTVLNELQDAIATVVVPAARATALSAVRDTLLQVVRGLDSSGVAASDALDTLPAEAPAEEKILAAVGRRKSRDEEEDEESETEDGVKQLTVKQAAKRCGLTPKFLYLAISRGKLKHRKIPKPPGVKRGPRDGKLTVVTLKDLREWRASVEAN